MFDWSKEGRKVIVKLPFWIYFGATASLVFFLVILFMIIRKPMETKEAGKTSQNDNTAESDTTDDGKESSVATGLNTGLNGSMNTKLRVRSISLVIKTLSSVI